MQRCYRWRIAPYKRAYCANKSANEKRGNMTTGIIDKKRLIFPGLAGLYETFSPASYSFMRFATGAVLIPHGIQKIMLGSAANLATVIDKQMGVSYPLIWAYFAIFAESVGAI